MNTFQMETFNLVSQVQSCLELKSLQSFRQKDSIFLKNTKIHFSGFRLCTDDSSGEAMNWSERLNVLTGVAKAVHFLHTGVIPGFFSNRLKTNNVLLNQQRFAKLSDYGLSIVSEATRHNTVKPVSLMFGFCFKFPFFC